MTIRTTSKVDVFSVPGHLPTFCSRGLMLLGTALGSTLVVAPAQAQNVSSTSNTTDYTLTETGTRSGGPRTIDVATSGGNILVDVGTVEVSNTPANNPANVTGAAVAANNTGAGTVTVRVANATATGPGLTNIIDARATSGAISITNGGIVTAMGNNGDVGILALSGGGDVTITSNIASGQRRGIFVGGNGGTFGDTGITTINSTEASANGTGLVNAIVGQGYGVVINSGTASTTNAGGVQGTAIFANASAGGVVINAGTTNAFGQNQAALQVFSEGAVDVTSGAVRTTQNSDGLSIASGTDVVLRSTSVVTEGPGGARGIVLGGNAGGGGFNSGPNGFAYTSAIVTSGSITTAGNGAYGIYVTPTGSGSTTINTGALRTTGDNATGVLVTRIGTGAIGGTILINNTGALQTGGNNAAGIQVNAGTGAVTIDNSGSITTAGSNAHGINVVPASGTTTVSGTGTIATSGVNAHGIYLNPSAGTNTGAVSITAGPITTSGAGAQGIWAFNAGGAVTINASDVRTTGTGAAIIVQQSAGATAPILVQAGTIRSGSAGAAINISSNGTTGPVIAGVVDSVSIGAAIDARSVGAVTLTGGTVRTTGANATGLVAISTGGTATVTSDTLTSANRGIYAQGLDNVSVTTGSLVSSNADFGLIARTSAASNNDPVVGTAEGVVTVNSTALTATNIGINAFGPRATINVTSGAVTTTAGSAIQAFGIDVNVASGTIITGATGIEAGMGTGATRRGATVVDSGAITLNGTAGTTNGAISASGATVNVTSGTILASGAGNRFGIAAQVPTSTTAGAPSPGALTVTSDSITTVGDGAYGIQAITDAGALTVNSTGTIATGGTTRQAGTQPRYSAGIIAVSGSGAIAVASNNIITQGAQADGVRVEAGAAIVSYTLPTNVAAAPIGVTTSGLTQTAGASANGIDVLGGGGAVSIANTGTVTTSGANALGIVASGRTGAVTVASNVVGTSGLGAGGIAVTTTTGAITIDALTTTTTGALDPNASSADAILAFATGAGTINVTSGTASATGDIASAVFAASTGGTVTVNSGTASTSGATGVAVGASARVAGDAIINATTTSATGAGASAVSASAVAGNATVVAGTASAAAGTAVNATAGRLASIAVTSATAGGNGGAGVRATGGTGVLLNVGSASSTGTAVTTTNARTGVVTVTRADAIIATATTGAIDATIGSASATGAGADAVRLIANGAGGAVTASITGALSSTSGTGLFIDPPGPVVIDIAAGAGIAGALNGINTTGASNSIANRGSVSSAGGAGIVAAGPTTLINSGAVGGAGDVAVQLGVGNDTVTLLTGSAITGRIVGGGGSDAAFLSGTGTVTTPTQTVAGFTGFSTLTVQNGYWTALADNGGSFADSVTTGAGATLEVANTATGLALIAPSFIDNGTLVVRSGAGSAGSTFGTSIVTGSGSVLFTGTGTATLDGTDTIQSTGLVTVDGGSTVLVTGTQGGSFATDAGGTLQLGNGGTTGSFTGSLVDNGVLVLNRSDTFTFAGPLAGTGAIVKQGAGEVVFGSGFAFTGVTTIQGGSIRLTSPVAATTELALEGNGQLDLSGTTQRIAELAGASPGASLNIAGASLTDVQNTDSTFAGSIVGAGGAFTKSGTGRLNLTGASSYTGPTTVNGGTLAVNGSIVSPVTVTAGGTLGGNGSVGSVTIGSGGTYAPGNSIGTQTVNGNVTFAAGSIFAVEANAAGQADRIDATGTATLQGGTVAVSPVAGSYANLTSYTILTAQTGVTGAFAGVTTADTTLTPFLAYGTNAVTLTLARNNVAFSVMGATPNGASVGGAITALGVGNGLYRALLPLSAAATASALSSLSGETYASMPAVLADSSKQVREAVLARATAPGEGVGLWATGTRTLAGSRNQPGIAPVIDNRWTAIGGIDFSLAGLRVGIDGGYIEDKTRVRRLGSEARATTKLVGGHAGYAIGPVSVVIGGDYAWHDIETSRSLGVAGLAGSTAADSEAHTVQGYGEIGYGVTTGVLTVLPFARFSYVRVVSDALTETGGLGALTATRDERHYKFGTVGLRMTGDAPLAGNVTFQPRGSISYTRGWDVTGSRTLSFAGTAPQFTVTGTALGRNALDVSAGFDLAVGKRLTIGAGGFGSTSRDWSDYGAKVSVGLKF